MKTKILLVALGCIFLQGCTNKEYVYNETVARLYYGVSENFEGINKKLNNNEYETTYDMVRKGKEFGVTNTGRDIQKLKTVAEGSILNMESLEPSPEGKELHDKMNLFFTKIMDEYIPQLDAYKNIDCDCPEQKDSIKQILNKVYNDISDLENNLLETQKEYHKKVGM